MQVMLIHAQFGMIQLLSILLIICVFTDIRSRLIYDGANPNSVHHWGQDGHQVTQNQYNQLLENQEKLTKMENQQKIIEKVTEKVVEEPVKDKFGLGKG
ncbi:hypothetical protein ACFO9Q_22400 [Paenibacillus sp. GCM10023252]|uniref:hypothetical protein n=1 Tax=Paenibacillus sp. GCM10023252 TaxID=3252649 RepID=UPI003618F38E